MSSVHIGNIKEVITKEFVEKCQQYASEFNKRGRTFSEVLKNTVFGESTEVLICKYLDLEQAPFETIMYDATKYSDGLSEKYEIKHTTVNSKYWSFSEYEYFLENAEQIDKIVLCYVDTFGDVYLKFIACAKTFKNYIQVSKFNDRFYYNHFKAIRDGNCEEF